LHQLCCTLFLVVTITDVAAIIIIIITTWLQKNFRNEVGFLTWNDIPISNKSPFTKTLRSACAECL
jgi:hypothetical protein